MTSLAYYAYIESVGPDFLVITTVKVWAVKHKGCSIQSRQASHRQANHRPTLHTRRSIKGYPFERPNGVKLGPSASELLPATQRTDRQ